MPTEPPLLEVTVISGKDLAPKDDNGFSDPYCVLRLSSGTGAKRTYPIKKTLNPTWNQTFELGALLPTSTLKLTCWDHDTFSSDDFMGQIVLDIGNRLLSDDKGWLNEWFQLLERGRNEGITGSLHLKFTIKKGEAKSTKTGGLLGAGGLLALVPDIPKALPSLGGSNSGSSSVSKPKKAKEITDSTNSDSKVFGVELDVVMKRQQARGCQEPVPIFYKKLIQYLRTVAPQEEGIFRIGGTHSKIIDLVDAVNAGEEVDYETIDVNDASGLLKRYLRDLPSPLLTFELFDSLVLKGPMPNADDYLDLLKASVADLPAVNLAMLEMLVDLMQLITANSDKNKMSTENLVICIGPNLLRDKTDSIMLNMEYLGKVQGIVTFLVQQHSYIFKFNSETVQPRSRLSKADKAESKRQVEGGRLFMTYDTNGDGNMDREEFAVFYREALMDISATDADVDSALRVLDRDGNNLISFQEFTEWWCRMHSRCDKALERAAVQVSSGSGPTRADGAPVTRLPPAAGGQSLLSPRQACNQVQRRGAPARGRGRGRGQPARARGPRGCRGAIRGQRGGRGVAAGQRGNRGQRGHPRGVRGLPQGLQRARGRGVPVVPRGRGVSQGQGFHSPPKDPAPPPPMQQ